MEPQVKEVKVEQNQEAQGEEEQGEEERTGWTNVDQQGAVMLCHIVWSHKLLFMFNSIKARNEWRNTHFLFQVLHYSLRLQTVPQHKKGEGRWGVGEDGGLWEAPRGQHVSPGGF